MASLYISKDLENLIKKIALDSMHPVGSIYLSVTSTNPGTFMGGTWVRVASAKYLIGYDSDNKWFDKLGANGGSNGKSGNWTSENTTLTIDQIPSHNHGSKSLTGKTPNLFTGTQNTGTNGIVSWGKYSNRQYTANGTSSNAWMYFNINATHTHDSQGGGKGHSHFHVSPYYIVYVWKRTA